MPTQDLLSLKNLYAFFSSNKLLLLIMFCLGTRSLLWLKFLINLRPFVTCSFCLLARYFAFFLSELLYFLWDSWLSRNSSRLYLLNMSLAWTCLLRFSTATVISSDSISLLSFIVTSTTCLSSATRSSKTVCHNLKSQVMKAPVTLHWQVSQPETTSTGI